MLSLFQRKRPSVAAAPSPAPTTDLPKGLMRPESAASLLATPRLQKLLEHIWQRTSLSRRQFATLYRTPLERYAELAQACGCGEVASHLRSSGFISPHAFLPRCGLSRGAGSRLAVRSPVSVPGRAAWVAG